MFDEVKIKLPSDKQMVIKTKNNAKDHPYIQSVTLNGRPYAKIYITHTTLLDGGVLEFVMGEKPNKKWGADPASWPSSVNN